MTGGEVRDLKGTSPAISSCSTTEEQVFFTPNWREQPSPPVAEEIFWPVTFCDSLTLQRGKPAEGLAPGNHGRRGGGHRLFCRREDVDFADCAQEPTNKTK